MTSQRNLESLSEESKFVDKTPKHKESEENSPPSKTAVENSPSTPISVFNSPVEEKAPEAEIRPKVAEVESFQKNESCSEIPAKSVSENYQVILFAEGCKYLIQKMLKSKASFQNLFKAQLFKI